ncbi:MAG TPA: hypothetical protein PKD20_00995 [Candidatus Saccharibacteria bacterium]|nr:hypothetical protein [Candidatus Saccharibacteria bacterium]HMT55432.1 hypothetical protein [Candidatus Saccharibacteria bacterium]
MISNENPALRDEDLAAEMFSCLEQSARDGTSEAAAFFMARAQSLGRTGIIYGSHDVSELFIRIKEARNVGE